jgi:pseudouridine-5'-phosphate glycosidase
MVSSEALCLESGILLAVPIPASEAASGALLAAAIDTALAEAQSKGIAGRNVTPYILARYAIIYFFHGFTTYHWYFVAY